MIFIETPIPDVLVVELDEHRDERGSFARFFCAEEFAARGLVPPVAQGNISVTNAAGTVRGLHWQHGAAAEAKLFRCINGRLFDVAVDVRADSATYLDHVGVELSAENGRALYVPPGVAHGYQTLTADATALYLVSRPYAPEAERGLCPTDPVLQIEWPMPISDVSDKDRQWPLLAEGSRKR